ncbi:hypothetical protein DPEC_G00275670 [Dallia pectoralis]|uniref:Uncharacterized protein n=1 Tax=Dallia pectoralis TaxID=75939 RepID=A0ACC2FLG5_DALPE|nr:hypothetical protein DPEC_G00275670 [Dallia pectoralis]
MMHSACKMTLWRALGVFYDMPNVMSLLREYRCFWAAFITVYSPEAGRGILNEHTEEFEVRNSQVATIGLKLFS